MHEQRHGEAPVGFMFTPLFLLLTPTLVDRSLFKKKKKSKTNELGPGEVKPTCWLGSDSWNPNAQMKPGNIGCDGS